MSVKVEEEDDDVFGPTSQRAKATPRRRQKKKKKKNDKEDSQRLGLLNNIIGHIAHSCLAGAFNRWCVSNRCVACPWSAQLLLHMHYSWVGLLLVYATGRLMLRGVPMQSG